MSYFTESNQNSWIPNPVPRHQFQPKYKPEFILFSPWLQTKTFHHRTFFLNYILCVQEVLSDSIYLLSTECNLDKTFWTFSFEYIQPPTRGYKQCFYTRIYVCLPQICTVILRIRIGKVAWFAVYICGNC